MNHAVTEPVAPESLPEYVREDVERQDATTLRELAAWAENLAEYREQCPIEVDTMDSPAVAANRRHGRSHP